MSDTVITIRLEGGGSTGGGDLGGARSNPDLDAAFGGGSSSGKGGGNGGGINPPPPPDFGDSGGGGPSPEEREGRRTSGQDAAMRDLKRWQSIQLRQERDKIVSDKRDWQSGQHSQMDKFYDKIYGRDSSSKANRAANKASEKSGFGGLAGSRLGRAASVFGAMHSLQKGVEAGAGGDAGGAAAGLGSAGGFAAAALTGNPMIAGLTMGFSTLTNTVSKANDELDKTAKKLERYSGALAAGNAQADMIEMQSDMRSAERVGPELAENRVMRAKAAAATQRFGDEIQLVFIRVENALMKLVGLSAKSGDNIALDQFRRFASMRIDEHGGVTHTPDGAPRGAIVPTPFENRRELQRRIGNLGAPWLG